ncbi:MAG: hypothetical protein F4Z32_00520 [Gemmatimonadetes bacterium]|nr:hypothetical protein [Gemmatimonadota bacterium]
MKKTRPKKVAAKRPVVKVPDSSYQPSRAQLRQDQRIKGATFDQAVGALTRQVKVKYVKQQRKKQQ